MEGEEFLASRHRSVVTQFIEAVVEEWACDMGEVERNVLGVALRHEIETRLVPGLLAVDALLVGADSETLGWLPEWLDLTSTVLPADAEFLTEMSRRLDPDGFGLLEDNLALRPGESAASRAFTDFLWEMSPGVTSRSAVT